MSKIVLIGANHAGTACANTILDNYKDEELVIFDQNSNISFLGCGMALWIGKQIKGPEKLFYCSKEVFEQKGATVHMETKVENIDYDKKFKNLTTNWYWLQDLNQFYQTSKEWIWKMFKKLKFSKTHNQ